MHKGTRKRERDILLVTKDKFIECVEFCMHGDIHVHCFISQKIYIEIQCEEIITKCKYLE